MKVFTMRCLALLMCLSIASCAQKPKEEPKAEEAAVPQPKLVKVAVDNPAQAPGEKPKTTKKNLFNVAVSKKGIYVNRVKVSNLAALESLISSTPAALLTLNAHRCLDAQKTSAILSMMQKYTTSPIAFGSFGEYTDPECAD